MPNKTVTYLLAEFQELKESFNIHLKESVDVHKKLENLDTNMFWVKWISMGIAGGIGVIIISLIIWLIQK